MSTEVLLHSVEEAILERILQDELHPMDELAGRRFEYLSEIPERVDPFPDAVSFGQRWDCSFFLLAQGDDFGQMDKWHTPTRDIGAWTVLGASLIEHTASFPPPCDLPNAVRYTSKKDVEVISTYLRGLSSRSVLENGLKRWERQKQEADIYAADLMPRSADDDTWMSLLENTRRFYDIARAEGRAVVYEKI
jgi:hypothetical protein